MSIGRFVHKLHRAHVRRRIKRVLGVGFALFVVAALVWAAQHVPWPQVLKSLRGYRLRDLAPAVGLAVASHLLYASYDLIGRVWTQHRLAPRRVLLVTFVSYAFNLNLGTLVGAIGLRYRLYSNYGLRTETIARVLLCSLLTNWLGYALLAGSVFALGVIRPPDEWALSGGALRGLGVAMWGIVVGYFALCRFGQHKRLRWRDHEFAPPPARMAAVQLALSCANWMTMGLLLQSLFLWKLPYALVLGSLLTAAVAGLLARVPAGLGVMEAVAIALLAPQADAPTVIAALLAYRAIYYIVPLLIAALVFLRLEATSRSARSRAPREPASATEGPADAPRGQHPHGEPHRTAARGSH